MTIIFSLYKAAVANRRMYGEDQPDPFPAGETINCWPPWDIDSCLVLAPDLSAKKNQSRKNLTKMKGHKNREKGLCHYRKSPEKELSWRSDKIDPVINKDGVYKFWWNLNHASKGGSTPDPLLRQSMDFEKTPIPNLFLSSLSESQGRDSF